VTIFENKMCKLTLPQPYNTFEPSRVSRNRTIFYKTKVQITEHFVQSLVAIEVFVWNTLV